MKNLKVYCCFCSQALQPARNNSDLLHCFDKRGPYHPPNQEIWVWVDDKVVNYRVDGIQLSFKMNNVNQVDNVVMFNINGENADFFNRIALAENFDLDFSEIKTLEDFRKLLKLLKAYG